MKNTEHKHFIKSFEIKNFRGIIDSGKVDIPEDTQWIFLTGENGFGKTSVLQAVAVGLYGKNKIKKQRVNTHSKIDILLENNTIHRGTSQGEGSDTYENVVAYGSSRLNILPSGSEKPNSIESLFDSLIQLENIEDEMIRWFRDDEEKYPESMKKFKSVKKAIIKLLNIKDIKVKEKKDKTQFIQYQEPFYSSDFANLAAGYRNIVATIGDMIIRLFRTQPNVFDIKKLQGIVIIDEFDLHLHPKWQRRLPQILTTVFPNVQFLVSTHSPIPILGAPKNSAFLKVTRNSEEGIKIENLDYVEVRNLTPNTILTSPIFDFEDFIPENDNDFLSLSVEDLYKDEVFYQILDKKLEKLSKEDENLLDELLK